MCDCVSYELLGQSKHSKPMQCPYQSLTSEACYAKSMAVCLVSDIKYTSADNVSGSTQIASLADRNRQQK